VSVVQLAILITVFAPFILAVWVAFMHWVQARRNPRGPTSGTDGFGSVRSRFAAKRPGVFARPKFVRFGLAIERCGTVRVDPSVLRGALRSLIGTTTRSTSSGQVPVTSLTRGRQMHVRVVDDGVGTDRMSHEIEACEAGTLVALQGATLAVEAGPNHSTTVTIWLLLSAGARPATSDPSASRVPVDQGD
jgi:hypothetical protein